VYGLTSLSTGVGEIRVPRLGNPVGTQLRIRIAARDVIVATERPSGISALNVLQGHVSAIEETGPAQATVTVTCGLETVVAALTRRSVHDLDLAVGRPVFAIVKSVAVDRG
jgi:molybdate transport system ATP-binding protein